MHLSFCVLNKGYSTPLGSLLTSYATWQNPWDYNTEILILLTQACRASKLLMLNSWTSPRKQTHTHTHTCTRIFNKSYLGQLLSQFFVNNLIYCGCFCIFYLPNNSIKLVLLSEFILKVVRRIMSPQWLIIHHLCMGLS